VDIALNSEPVKYVLLAITAPFWIPFFRALYDEFNNAILDEGGLFGDPPSAEQIEKIRAERAHIGEALTSELLDGVVVGGLDAGAERAAGSAGGSPRAPKRPRGFRN